MRIFQVSTLVLLVASIAVNVVLGTRLYEQSKVGVGDGSVYGSFEQALNNTTDAVQKASNDTKQQQKSDLITAESQVQMAIGTLMGLRPEADKRGLDFGPTIRALRTVESKVSQDITNTNTSDISSALSTLQKIQTGLKGTTYQNGQEFKKLKSAVKALNSKLWG